MLRTLLFAACLLLSACQFIQAPPSPPLQGPEQGLDARQIHWQRSLADALELSKANGRPLLVALNMDGESASERIVRERYRDPQFVAWTRHFVCVIGSVYRHNLLDHDAHGARLPCPRLGEVTCGEHIALEPELFQRFLGEPRIAPRHALIQPDGAKSFDLYLLFDLGELDRALETAAGRTPAAAPLESAGLGPAARTQRGRAQYEEFLRGAIRPEAELRRLQDSGRIELEALCALAIRAESAAPEFSSALGKAAVEAALAEPYARFLRARLTAPADGDQPTIEARGGRARHLLGLAECIGALPALRTLLLAEYAAGLADERALVRRALQRALAPGELAALEARLAEAGGPLDARRALALAVARLRTEPRSDARAAVESAALESALVSAEQALRAAEGDPAAQAAYGRAALDLARARLAQGSTREIAFLLEDARTWLQRADTAAPDSIETKLALCEAHYRLSEFPEQDAAACAALMAHGPMPAWDGRSGEDAAATARRLSETLDASFTLREALRWVGDGAARNLARRASPADAREELGGILRGADALSLLALSAHAGESDLAAVASFHEALGLEIVARGWWHLALSRLPESTAIRDGLLAWHWRHGSLASLTQLYEDVAVRHPLSAACRWFAGSARVFEAEDLRRREAPRESARSYARAIEHFERAAALYAEQGAPELAAGAREQLGRVWLGLGFARLIEDDRAAAADSLAQALAIAPGLVDARDGLERAPVDLVDQCLEWRASGESPVEPLALLERLPAQAVWALRVADAQLREARRALRRSALEAGRVHAKNAAAAARRAIELERELERERADSEAARRTLMLSLWLLGESELGLERLEPARQALEEAAALAGIAGAGETSPAALRTLLAELTRLYGEAAPIPREGR